MTHTKKYLLHEELKKKIERPMQALVNDFNMKRAAHMSCNPNSGRYWRLIDNFTDLACAGDPDKKQALREEIFNYFTKVTTYKGTRDVFLNHHLFITKRDAEWPASQQNPDGEWQKYWLQMREDIKAFSEEMHAMCSYIEQGFANSPDPEDSAKINYAQKFLQTIDDVKALMDSDVKRVSAFARHEDAPTPKSADFFATILKDVPPPQEAFAKLSALKPANTPPATPTTAAAKILEVAAPEDESKWMLANEFVGAVPDLKAGITHSLRQLNEIFPGGDKPSISNSAIGRFTETVELLQRKIAAMKRGKYTGFSEIDVKFAAIDKAINEIIVPLTERMEKELEPGIAQEAVMREFDYIDHFRAYIAQAVGDLKAMEAQQKSTVAAKG